MTVVYTGLPRLPPAQEIAHLYGANRDEYFWRGWRQHCWEKNRALKARKYKVSRARGRFLPAYGPEPLAIMSWQQHRLLRSYFLLGGK